MLPLVGLAPHTARRMKADRLDEDVPLTHVHGRDSLRIGLKEKVPVGGADWQTVEWLAVSTVTAQEHQLIIATRHVKDFVGCGVQVMNPFEWNLRNLLR